MTMSNNEILKNLRIWSVVGIFLSTYATYVELKAERSATEDDKYSALCDISPKISCTAVFTSVYGRGFGVLQSLLDEPYLSWIPPNGAIGIIFYTLLLFSSLWHHSICLSYLWLFLAIASNLLSIYLAYLLYFVLENLCLICVAIYVVNFFCLRQIWRIHNINTNQKRAKTITNCRNFKNVCENKEQ